MLIRTLLKMLALVIQASKRLLALRSVRSANRSTVIDYFSVKPIRTRPEDDHRVRQSSSRPSTPHSVGGPLKSPTQWLISSSVGTQNSSAGSSVRGSSWANNLSTFFKSGGNASGTGDDTPPHIPVARQYSPASLSPAFVKRTAITPLTELKRAGGIASARPSTPTPRVKARTATHVSFATTTSSKPVYGSDNKSSAKIVIRHLNATERGYDRSLLLSPLVQAQLECHRLQFAELLHRLGLSQQRVQVLKLTRAAVDGSNKIKLRSASGIAAEEGPVLVLDFACLECTGVLSERPPSYCLECRKKRKPLPCAFCHLPLRGRSHWKHEATQLRFPTGLTETCLKCLHTCHLECLQQWRQLETTCPASCGCE